MLPTKFVLRSQWGLYLTYWGALHFGAANGYIGVIGELLAFHANIDLARKQAGPPLIVAVRYGHTDAAEYLLENNAKPNKTDGTGSTALHIAARIGQTDMIEMLLKHGANPNKRDNLDETPLFTAVRACNVGAVCELLDHNFNPATVNKDRQTALHVACQTGSADIVRKLIEFAVSLDSKDLFGNTPLHYATMNDWPDIINTLLLRNADAGIRNSKGRSPFFYASVEGAKVFRNYFQNEDSIDHLAQSMQMRKNSPVRSRKRSPRKAKYHSALDAEPKLMRKRLSRKETSDDLENGSPLQIPRRTRENTDSSPQKQSPRSPDKSDSPHASHRTRDSTDSSPQREKRGTPERRQSPPLRVIRDMSDATPTREARRRKHADDQSMQAFRTEVKAELAQLQDQMQQLREIVKGLAQEISRSSNTSA